MEPITIILTTPEMQLWEEYKQFHEAFAILVKSGVFDIKYGKAILNFNGGILQNVTREEVIYKR